MKKKVSLSIAVVVLMLMTLSFAVLAIDKSSTVSGGTLTEGDTGRLSGSAAGSDGAQAGNVTEINISSTSSTAKWSGYFGHVTTSLKLGIASDVLYDFGSVVNNQIKSVFASSDSAFDFSNLLAATVGEVDTTWGFSTPDVDSATSTFTGATTIAQVASVPTVGLNAYEDTGTAECAGCVLNTSIYKSGLFKDTASPANEIDFAFGVSVDADERDFKNQTLVDYELVVPVNTSGLGGTETYYFFLDVE